MGPDGRVPSRFHLDPLLRNHQISIAFVIGEIAAQHICSRLRPIRLRFAPVIRRPDNRSRDDTSFADIH
jgi:hypothetical protein